MSTLLRTAITGGVIATEEASTGVANRETEYVFYGRMTDMAELEKAASHENHQQWEIKIPKTEDNATEGRFRIRKTTNQEGTDEYVLTTKNKIGAGTNNEVSLPTTKDHFEQFKLMAHNGMIKDRYHFPIEGTDLVWEVDVFLKPEGGYYDWVKIDLEVPSPLTEFPPFPVTMDKVIDPDPSKREDDDEAQVKALYAHTFLTKNPNL